MPVNEYDKGYADAISDVMHMFNQEHAWYQQLWKHNAHEDAMRESETKLITINEIIYELVSRQKLTCRKGR